MKSLRRTIPLLAAIALAAGACGQRPDPAVGRDFAHYKAQMVSVLPIEQRAIDANREATEAPGVSDAKYTKAIREKIVPALEEFGEELSRMRPLTEPVQELHRMYLRRIVLLVSGFRELEKAARTGDKALIASFKGKAAEAKALIEAWNRRVEEMNKIYKGGKKP